MQPYELAVVIIAWLISLMWGAAIVTEVAARKIARRFGVTRVSNREGRTIYAPLDPSGHAMKIPVGRDSDGEIVLDYAPLAYSLPYIAASTARDMLIARLTGKAGRTKQLAEEALREQLPLNQASQAMALEALARGRYAQALVAWLAPKIAQTIQRSTPSSVNLGGGQK